MCMVLKRTTVYAESEDLAIIKAAARTSGVSEAEIIREAIHRAALARREWKEPLDAPRFASGDATLAGRTGEILAEEFGTGKNS